MIALGLGEGANASVSRCTAGLPGAGYASV